MPAPPGGRNDRRVAPTSRQLAHRLLDARVVDVSGSGPDLRTGTPKRPRAFSLFAVQRTTLRAAGHDDDLVGRKKTAARLRRRAADRCLRPRSTLSAPSNALSVRGDTLGLASRFVLLVREPLCRRVIGRRRDNVNVRMILDASNCSRPDRLVDGLGCNHEDVPHAHDSPCSRLAPATIGGGGGDRRQTERLGRHASEGAGHGAARLSQEPSTPPPIMPQGAAAAPRSPPCRSRSITACILRRRADCALACAGRSTPAPRRPRARRLGRTALAARRARGRAASP